MPNIPFFSSFLAEWTSRLISPAENGWEDSLDCSEDDLDLMGDPVRSTVVREMLDILLLT